MKAKTKETIAYLSKPQRLDAIIKNRLVEKQMLKDIALGITGQTEGERVQSSGSKQKMSDAIEKMVDLEREIDRLVDSYVNAKEEINGIIEQLNTAEYDVLHKLYIQGMAVDEIAIEKNRSKSWVTTVHGRALANIQNILTERKKENGTGKN